MNMALINIGTIPSLCTNKGTGPDSIQAELLEALEDYGIDKIISLQNEIYDTGQIAPDISKSIFIAKETRGNSVWIT